MSIFASFSESEIRTHYMASRAWIDEDDVKETKSFLKPGQTKVPEWASTGGSDATAAAVGDEAVSQEDVLAGIDLRRTTKRHRNVELDEALASATPVLNSNHQRTTNAKPVILNVFPLQKDMATAIEWHKNSQLCTVAGQQTVYVFHASGKYVETLSKIHVGGSRIESMKLTNSGDEAIVMQHESFVPLLVGFAKETKQPLNFLDTRENFAFRHDYRKDTHGRAYQYMTRIAIRPRDTNTGCVAVAHGNCVILGSLSSASVIQKINVSDPVLDIGFTGHHELTVAVHDKLQIFDIRKSAKMLREFTDEGSIGTSATVFNDQYFAIASKSGVVNVYEHGATKPTKSLKNLTTNVTMLALGQGKQGPVLAMATSESKNGARLVKLPSCMVVPAFPDVSARHGFFHAIAVAPNAPVLSLGERGKITNYVV